MTLNNLQGISLEAVVPDAARRFDVEGRVMFPMLETFDPIARPIDSGKPSSSSVGM